MQTYPRLGRQVVKQRGGVLEKQRQVILNPRRGDALADTFVQRRTRRIAFKLLAEILPETRLPGLVQRKFPRRQQPNFRHRIQRALAIHIERRQLVDLIVKQINAIRQHAAHGEQVDNPAAHAKLARRQHLLHMAIARQRQLLAQGWYIQLLAAFQEKGISRQIGHRRQRIQGGGDGRNQHIASPAAQMVQGRQALGNQILMRGKMVIRQGFPVRQQMHAQGRIEKANFLAQPLRLQGTGRNHHQRLTPPSPLRQPQRIRRPDQPRKPGPGIRTFQQHDSPAKMTGADYSGMGRWMRKRPRGDSRQAGLETIGLSFTTAFFGDDLHTLNEVRRCAFNHRCHMRIKLAIQFGHRGLGGGDLFFP